MIFEHNSSFTVESEHKFFKAPIALNPTKPTKKNDTKVFADQFELDRLSINKVVQGMLHSKTVASFDFFSKEDQGSMDDQFPWTYILKFIKEILWRYSRIIFCRVCAELCHVLLILGTILLLNRT